MLDLILSVLCSTLILVIFKLYGTYGIQTLYAIIVNYLVACCTGLFFYKGPIALSALFGKDWIWGTLALGVLFISIF
ncbi:MAG: EamA/RhaT family transporter, partial [Bacteroidota bacterium]